MSWQKILVFDVKYTNCVYIHIVKGCSASELLPILQDYSDFKELIVYSDCFFGGWGLMMN